MCRHNFEPPVSYILTLLSFYNVGLWPISRLQITRGLSPGSFKEMLRLPVYFQHTKIVGMQYAWLPYKSIVAPHLERSPVVLFKSSRHSQFLKVLVAMYLSCVKFSLCSSSIPLRLLPQCLLGF